MSGDQLPELSEFGALHPDHISTTTSTTPLTNWLLAETKLVRAGSQEAQAQAVDKTYKTLRPLLLFLLSEMAVMACHGSCSSSQRRRPPRCIARNQRCQSWGTNSQRQRPPSNEMDLMLSKHHLSRDPCETWVTQRFHRRWKFMKVRPGRWQQRDKNGTNLAQSSFTLW